MESEGSSGSARRIPRAEDPVWLVHAYRDPLDQEIAGLVAATCAYGRVDLLVAAAATILGALGSSPRAALDRGEHRAPGFLQGFVYRWTRGPDVVQMLEGVALANASHGSLGAALSFEADTHGSLERGLPFWVSRLRGPAASAGPISRGLRFLLADPARASACKRWRLFLRWMVRTDGIDLGPWSHRFDSSELILPLDAHWARIAPRLGLSRRRTQGHRMALEVTAALRRMRPEDPLYYDFAVCHLGISGGCPPRLERSHCSACPLLSGCSTGARVTRRRGDARSPGA